MNEGNKTKQSEGHREISILEHAKSGELSLSNHRKIRRVEAIEKFVKFAFLVLVVGVLVYRVLWYESGYYVIPQGRMLSLEKTTGLITQTREIKRDNGRWKACSVTGKQTCEELYTPFEAFFGESDKFVFVEKGDINWIRRDRTKLAIVRLIDGEWSFQYTYEDEWNGFDSLDQEPQADEPYDPR